jgi:hypothetical protein
MYLNVKYAFAPSKTSMRFISLGYRPPFLQNYRFALEYDDDNPVSLGIASETQRLLSLRHHATASLHRAPLRNEALKE